MADENNTPPYQDDDKTNVSPSALFLEMMRQAAMRDTDGNPPDPEIPQDLSFADLEFRMLPDNDAVSDLDEQQADDETIEDAVIEQADTVYIPEETLFPDAEPSPLDIHPREFETPEPIKLEPAPEPVSHEPEPVPIAKRRVPIYTAPEETIAEEARVAQLEAQRVRRLRRRQERRQRRRVGVLGGFLRTIFAVFIAATLASTVFTWFTDPEFFTPNVVTGLQLAESTSVAAAVPLTPTVIEVTPNWARRIGIVSGHAGPEDDPGAVCEDGLTEREINFGVAQLVVRNLRELGYTVDLLDEFDPRLIDYQAAALVSIHANDCRDYGEYVSGYLVARAAARPGGGFDDILAECVGREYAEIGIERRFSLTVDMTDYHTFREIHQLTPAAILELGFMKDDRDLLVNQQPLLAEKITNGIACFLNGENPIITGTEFPTEIPEPTVTPNPIGN